MSALLLPILCYHHVGVRVEPHGHRHLWVSAERFAEQVALLAGAGYQGLALRDCVPFLREGKRPPARSVVLTFDDAYLNFFEHALPVLKRHQFSGTVFVATGEVGGVSRWDPGFESPTMTWTQLREVHEAGIECASHTISHPRLPQTPAAQAKHELTASRMELEDRLGAKVRTIAYPFGHFDASVERLADEAGYDLACTILRGNRHAAGDRLRLKRVPVTQYTSAKKLRYRLGPLYDLSCKLRRAKERLLDGAMRMIGKTPAHSPHL